MEQAVHGSAEPGPRSRTRNRPPTCAFPVARGRGMFRGWLRKDDAWNDRMGSGTGGSGSDTLRLRFALMTRGLHG